MKKLSKIRLNPGCFNLVSLWEKMTCMYVRNRQETQGPVAFILRVAKMIVLEKDSIIIVQNCRQNDKDLK